MPQDLEQLIAAYRQKAVPPNPSNLGDSVWRSIRLRKSKVGWQEIVEGFLSWLNDTRLIGASVAAALVIGISFNFMWLPVPSTQKAMGLDVFAPGPASPLSQLASNP
jgi:hypothetical protein